MTFASAKLVLASVAALEGAHGLSIVTIPALLRAAKSSGADPTKVAVPFGSTEELALLKDYFLLPRPPEADRPFLAPWAKGEWQKEKYAGGGLQRSRTDLSSRGEVFVQNKSKPRDTWALTPTAGADLMKLKNLHTPTRIVDLAVWFGRNEDVDSLPAEVIAGLPATATDLDKLVAWFQSEFGPDQGDLVGTLYSDEIPDEYGALEFSPDPVDESTYQQLGSLPPAPVVNGTLDNLVGRLEQRVVDGGFQLPAGLVKRVLTAWMRGDIVILVGQPGTGKTFFAGLLGRAMEAELELDAPLLVPVRADFDEAEFIGYERLDGKPQYREFTTAVLQSENPFEAHVVILEEFNLASIETYLSSVLIAGQDQERLVRLPAGQPAQLPIDTFIIATCNSYRDEPETRTRVSSPTKRRSTIITMPNVLSDRYDANPDEAVLALAIGLVRAEHKRVQGRGLRNAASQFDGLRLQALDSVTTLDDLSTALKDALKKICSSILETSTGRSWFTLGLLRDVVLNVVHAGREEQAELAALGDAVADKLVHQVRGTFADVEDLRLAYAALPNALEIDRLLDRMMDGPSDEILSLL